MISVMFPSPQKIISTVFFLMDNLKTHVKRNLLQHILIFYKFVIAVKRPGIMICVQDLIKRFFVNRNKYIQEG